MSTGQHVKNTGGGVLPTIDERLRQNGYEKQRACSLLRDQISVSFTRNPTAPF